MDDSCSEAELDHFALPGSIDQDTENFEDEHLTKSPEVELRERISTRLLSFEMFCPARCTCPTRYRVTEREPKDRFNLVYVCMLMAGAGFLLPWSSYISAIDYFFFLYRSDFPRVSEAIPLTYLLTTLFFSTINIGLVSLLSIHTRIRFGYVMFALSLVFIPLLDIGIHNCTVSTHVSYYLTLISIVAVGIGSGVQQSSYYGLSSMLPRRYSQAVMAGESVAGVLISITRIITKLSIESERLNSIIFFVISLLFVLACFCCHIYIQCSPFVKYHTVRCQKNKKETNRRGRKETSQCQNYKMKEFPCSSNPETSGYGSAPTTRKQSDLDDNELSGFSDNDEVELIPSAEDNGHGDGNNSDAYENEASCEYWSRTFWNGLQIRWAVMKQIWMLMIAIFINYFITLLVFPGLVSEVQFCAVGDWMPVILIAVFNVTDFVAKWLTLLPCSNRWTSFRLMLASISRFVLVPLILLCIVPSPSSPVIGSVAVVVVAVLFNSLLGITNGFFGSLPMVNVSKEVTSDKDKELAGTIMTWVLLFGLTLGSVLAYALTPLTRLAQNTDCHGNNTQAFICSHGNMSLTS